MSLEDVLDDIFRSSSVIELTRKSVLLGKNFSSLPNRERELLGKLLDPKVTIGDFINDLLESEISFSPNIIRSFILLRQSNIVKGQLSLVNPLEINISPVEHVMLNKLSRPMLFRIIYEIRKFYKQELSSVPERTWNSTAALLDIRAVEEVAKAYVLSQLMIHIKIV